MTLEEIIRKRLEEASITEGEKTKIVAKNADAEDVTAVDKVDVTPTKKKVTKESLDAMSDEDFLKFALTEESLDVMDEVEFNTLAEQYERLDEVSKEVLRSYIDKAQTDTAKQWNVGNDKKLLKRQVGVGAAAQKLAGVNRHAVMTKESVSSQVSALLEAEGLSEDFKTSAVTIFEAAVTDRVLQIEEGLTKEFDSQLAEAKAELDTDIDGFLTEAIQKWMQDNQVAIKANFKSQVHESFMDGLSKLIAEHNIEVPEDKEDALATAVEEVEKLNESIKAHAAEMLALNEQVNGMKAEKILESFKAKMAVTEFDRFKQLTEAVKFETEEQYEKQLTIVLENFGTDKTKKIAPAPITEVILENNLFVSESTTPKVQAYADYISGKSA